VIDPFVTFIGYFRVVAVSMNGHFLLTFSRAEKEILQRREGPSRTCNDVAKGSIFLRFKKKKAIFR